MSNKNEEVDVENISFSLDENISQKKRSIDKERDWDKISNITRYWMKLIFFIIITSTYLVAFAIAIYFFFIALKLENNVAKIATILGSLATFITTIVTLPTIIAKHLFPINETERKFKTDATTDKVINKARQNYNDSKLDDKK